MQFFKRVSFSSCDIILCAILKLIWGPWNNQYSCGKILKCLIGLCFFFLCFLTPNILKSGLPIADHIFCVILFLYYKDTSNYTMGILNHGVSQQLFVNESHQVFLWCHVRGGKNTDSDFEIISNNDDLLSCFY